MGKQQDNGPITTQIDHKVDNLQASNSQGGFRLLSIGGYVIFDFFD